MYKYVKDTVFLKQMGRDCIGHLKSLRKIINNEKRLKVDFKLLGNDPLIMTIQEGINPLEIPFILDIQEIVDVTLDESNIKNYLMDCFNRIEGSAFGSSIDAKFVLDTKYIWYTTGNNTKFKISISIHQNKEDGIYRLIKTNSSHKFELIPNSKDVFKKELRLKQLGFFENIRVTYLNKKNKYFQKNEEQNHALVDCYFEAVSDSYKKYIK